MIGFAILSHDKPHQLRRLVEVLGKLYDDPPVACHHDWSQAELDPGDYPGHVRFVMNALRTRWAHWSVTAGVLRALRLLYETADPDWFVLLSAVDYPIRHGDAVKAELSDAGVDAFLDLRPVGGDSVSRHIGSADPDLAVHDNLPLARRRYRHARLVLPEILTRRGGPWLRQSYRLPFASPLQPFDDRYRCYVGSQWFTGNRRVARKLLHPSEHDDALRRFYQVRWHADESYVNTVIGNDESLSVDRDPRRFSRWGERAAHPCVLGQDDVPAMLKSGKHFARKFADGSPAIAALNRALHVDARGLHSRQRGEAWPI